MATHSYYHQGSKWEENQGGFFFFPNAGEMGEQEALKQNISIIHFSISCPSSSNRMEFLKNL